MHRKEDVVRGGRQEEESWHVSFIGDAKGRGASCIRFQAELHVDVSSSFFPCLPPSVILSFPFIYLTQLGHLRPPQAADTTMYRITCKGQRNQFATELNPYILQHLAVTHSLTGSHYYSFQCKQCQLTLIASVHHTHQKHQHNDSRQLEVLHTHGSCQVTTRGLKCDRLNAVQRGGF